MNEMYQLLTARQKEELGKVIFEKLLREVEAIKVSPGTINLAKIINDDLKTIIENGDGFISYDQANIIGSAAATAIAKKIKDIIV